MSMKMCFNGHDSIVYTDYDHKNRYHKCPLCEALSKIAELEEENASLTKNAKLSGDNMSLRQEVM
jgi:hypothetical protein